MRKHGLAIAVLAAVLVAALYANSLHNGFHFDDGHSIQDNAFLRDLRHLPAYFTDVRTFSPLAENRSYRPILLLGYALSHALSGGAPWGYHVGSMLLHALAALVVGLLSRRLLRAAGHSAFADGAAGLIAAAIFAAHPLLSETVNYLSARSSLQSAALSFAAVLLYVHAREDGRRWLFVASGFALTLALLTKLTAVTAPALMLAWELLLGPDRADLRAVPVRRWLQRILPFFALTAGLTVMHEVIVGPYARGARSIITPWSHLLTQTQVWMRYQALYIWPEDLCADLTMRWSESPLEGPTARAILFVVVLAVFAATQFRKFPVTVFGLIWFYVTLAPTNSIMPLSEPATEHRVYIALPGLIMITVEGAALLLKGRRRMMLGAAVACALLVGWSARTIERNKVWKDSVSLWGSVLQCAPDNGRAHLNYGRGLVALGDMQGAREAYARCAQLWPGYAFCPINQAALELSQDNLQQAEQFAARAVELQPANVYARYWSGAVDLKLERFQAAAASFSRALEIAPGFEDAQLGLGRAQFELGQLEQAEVQLRPFAERERLDAGGWYAWGFLKERAGEAAHALEAYSRALSLDPGHTRARYNRGALHHRAHNLGQALADYGLLAQSADPGPDLLFNLALAQWALADRPAALETRQRLARQYPGYVGIGRLNALWAPQ